MIVHYYVSNKSSKFKLAVTKMKKSKKKTCKYVDQRVTDTYIYLVVVCSLVE